MSNNDKSNRTGGTGNNIFEPTNFVKAIKKKNLKKKIIGNDNTILYGIRLNFFFFGYILNENVIRAVSTT